MTPRTLDLVTALGLLGLLAGGAWSAPRWARLFQQELAAPADEGAPGTSPADAEDAHEAEARRSINVRLFFGSARETGLVLEDREVAFSDDLSRQLRGVLAELIKGPAADSGLLATLPAETRVLEVFVTARGVAYVDLSSEAARGLPGGASEELRAVYSVVNSISINFPAIRRVQILVEDKPAQTLAGHVDLSHPLIPDMTLLASSTLLPVDGSVSEAPRASGAPEPVS